MSDEGPAGTPETRTVRDGSAARFEPAPLPDRIGSYRILSKLGEGGMGVVFEAEQSNPKRRVAVKVIRGGTLVDERHLKMFQREADTLARLKHPNIAAIYEAGRTESGEHFFAMELVRGRELNGYLRRRPRRVDRAEIDFRLRLFRKLCGAVHYAHQRGVIHRDLKPANVIVVEDSTRPGVPELKVLDFGLARITDSDVAAATVVSEIGAIKGTLPYMSPEQSRGNPDEIDIRSDVYAMGVILFEMLTGRRPIDVSSGSIAEAVHSICETQPMRLRQAWPGTIRPDGDLQTIIGKALEKEPDRRYAAAAAFADDIDRYLSSQPILARPPSNVYLLRKFAGRNKILVGGTLATFLALIAGIVVSTIERRQAETARDDLAAVVDFQAGMIADLNPQRTGERILQTLSRRIRDAEERAGTPPEMIDERVRAAEQAARKVNPTDLARIVLDRNILSPASESATRQFSSRPEIEAQLLVTIGRTYDRLGLHAEATPHFERALTLLEAALGPTDPRTLTALEALGSSAMKRGDFEIAVPYLSDLLDRCSRALGSKHAETLRIENKLAGVRWQVDRSEEAEASYLATLERQRRQLGAAHPQTLGSMENLGVIYFGQGRYAEAEAMWSEALRLMLDNEDLGAEHPETLGVMTKLASVYRNLDRPNEAEELFVQALDVQTRTMGDDHPSTVRTRASLALVYRETGELEAAIRLQRDTLRIRRRDSGERHPYTLRAMNNLAVALMADDRHEEAATLLTEVVTLDREIQPGSSDHAVHVHSLAELQIELGDLAAAEHSLLDALEIYRRTEHRYTSLALFQLGQIMAREGRRRDALDYLRQALEAGHRRGWDPQAPEFARLRNDPAFLELVAKAQSLPRRMVR